MATVLSTKHLPPTKSPLSTDRVCQSDTHRTGSYLDNPNKPLLALRSAATPSSSSHSSSSPNVSASSFTRPTPATSCSCKKVQKWSWQRSCKKNDWLEETGNIAWEGPKTLVVGRKRLTAQQYTAFKHGHHKASVETEGRNEAMAGVSRRTVWVLGKVNNITRASIHKLHAKAQEHYET